MKLKKGVILHGLKIEMRIVLIAAEEIWKYRGQELVVTCGLEGTHSARSLHYYGYALDLRTRDFSPGMVDLVAEKLRGRLPDGYDVVVHKTHIHVEYDAVIDRR